MQHFKFGLTFILLPFISFCQNKPFEIFGTITGDYRSKIYLFFDGNYRQRDSISSEIKDGKFYFKGAVPLPIQGRVYMGNNSFITDIYIDNSNTYIKCMSKMRILNKGQDTMNL